MHDNVIDFIGFKERKKLRRQERHKETMTLIGAKVEELKKRKLDLAKELELTEKTVQAMEAVLEQDKRLSAKRAENSATPQG